jgi:hypothetical protein
VHVALTRHPTDAWVAQQLREATPFGQHPKHLLRDNDGTFGPAFARVAKASGIEEVRIAYRAPRMHAVVERFLGSVRRECLDHMIVLGDRHLERILTEYTRYFNFERPSTVTLSPNLSGDKPTACEGSPERTLVATARSVTVEVRIRAWASGCRSRPSHRWGTLARRCGGERCRSSAACITPTIARRRATWRLPPERSAA